MRSLIDAQLPPALARLLESKAHQAEHVAEIRPADASDRDLSDYALEHGAVLVAKDEDFAAMIATGATSPVVVWVRIGNTRRAPLLAWFEEHLDEITTRVEAGEALIEIR